MGIYRNHGKRVLDLAAAALGLLALLPLLGVIALLVRWRLGRPVLFRQWRPGLNCEMFGLIKFRTMTDARDGQGSLLPDPERLTPFGKLLRMSSLDELPELWNVLMGDLSLVGPRPLLAEYLPFYTPREATRHTVRPGITGLAQVSGRNLLGWDQRLECDARYAESISLSMDIRILWRTLVSVIRAAGVEADTSQAEGNLARIRASSVEGNTRERTDECPADVRGPA